MSEPRLQRAGVGLSTVGATVVAVLMVAAVAAPLLAPWDPNLQIDPGAARYLAPGTTRWVVLLRSGEWLTADELEKRDGSVVLRRAGEWKEVPSGDLASDVEVGPRRHRFLLGTDRYGRDLLSRLLFGARTSLMVGLVAAALAALLGVAVGATAGWRGGVSDAVLMRSVDALMMFPRLLLVLVLAAFWPAGPLRMALLVGATGWMELARVVRGAVRAMRGGEVAEAARAAGVPPWRILWVHLLPHVLPLVAVDAALRVGDAILLEASLSFLGLGIQPPTSSWGNLIAEAQDALGSAPWAAVIPGAAVALTVYGFGALADGLRDRLDPRTR